MAKESNDIEVIPTTEFTTHFGEGFWTKCPHCGKTILPSESTCSSSDMSNNQLYHSDCYFKALKDKND